MFITLKSAGDERVWTAREQFGNALNSVGQKTFIRLSMSLCDLVMHKEVALPKWVSQLISSAAFLVLSYCVSEFITMQRAMILLLMSGCYKGLQAHYCGFKLYVNLWKSSHSITGKCVLCTATFIVSKCHLTCGDLCSSASSPSNVTSDQQRTYSPDVFLSTSYHVSYHSYSVWRHVGQIRLFTQQKHVFLMDNAYHLESLRRQFSKQHI